MKSIFKKCSLCHKEFKAFACHFNRYLFCSKECKMQSTHLSKKIHKYRNGYKCVEIKVSPKKWRKFHRYVMENHIGRELTRDEIIHHIDEDTTNNDISNLKIVTKAEHRKLHEIVTKFSCQWCKCDFHRNTRRPRKFCSLSCSCKYGNSLKKLRPPIPI